MMRNRLKLSLLTVLGMSCGNHEDFDSGIEDFKTSVEYSALIGQFILDPDSLEIKYLGPNCTEEINISRALNEIGYYEPIIEHEDLFDKPINVYARWDDDDSIFDLRQGEIILNCLDTNHVSLYIKIYGEDDTDSSNYMNCVYETQLLECNSFGNPDCTLVQ